MIDYPNRINDPHVVKKLREIIDHVNEIAPKTASTAQAVAALTVPTIPAIQQALAIGGSNPLNITGLQGVTGGVQPSASIGTHAQRLITAPVVGTFWVETDRLITYVGEKVSNATVWVYQSGVMYDTFTNRPTDLTSNDVGFLYVPSDHLHWCKWTGVAWVILDDDGGTFKDSARALGAGYQLCDGSATTYLTISGADLAETAFTTPDENSGAAGVYHTSIGAYTGTINAATAPTLSGSTASTTATNNATVTGITVTAHNVTQINAAAGANNYAFTASADANHTVNDPTHNHTQNGHTHGAGTLAVSTTGQPRNLGVLRYFRK